MTVDRRLLAACAAGALLGFTGCGEEKLDTKRVVKFMKQGIERDNPGTKVVSIDCPSRPRKKGDVFKCQVRGSRPNQRALATMVQLNDKNDVRYSVR